MNVLFRTKIFLSYLYHCYSLLSSPVTIQQKKTKANIQNFKCNSEKFLSHNVSSESKHNKNQTAQLEIFK